MVLTAFLSRTDSRKECQIWQAVIRLKQPFHDRESVPPDPQGAYLRFAARSYSCDPEPLASRLLAHRALVAGSATRAGYRLITW